MCRQPGRRASPACTGPGDVHVPGCRRFGRCLREGGRPDGHQCSHAGGVAGGGEQRGQRRVCVSVCVCSSARDACDCVIIGIMFGCVDLTSKTALSVTACEAVKRVIAEQGMCSVLFPEPRKHPIAPSGGKPRRRVCLGLKLGVFFHVFFAFFRYCCSSQSSLRWERSYCDQKGAQKYPGYGLVRRRGWSISTTCSGFRLLKKLWPIPLKGTFAHHASFGFTPQTPQHTMLYYRTFSFCLPNGVGGVGFG